MLNISVLLLLPERFRGSWDLGCNLMFMDEGGVLTVWGSRVVGLGSWCLGAFIWRDACAGSLVEASGPSVCTGGIPIEAPKCGILGDN